MLLHDEGGSRPRARPGAASALFPEADPVFVDALGLLLRYIAPGETFDRAGREQGRHRIEIAAPPASTRSAAHVRGARAARRRRRSKPTTCEYGSAF